MTQQIANTTRVALRTKVILRLGPITPRPIVITVTGKLFAVTSARKALTRISRRAIPKIGGSLRGSRKAKAGQRWITQANTFTGQSKK
jgi:hypothetical protein